MDSEHEGLVHRAEPYVTVDGSRVVELVRPERGGSRKVSVAEAFIESCRATRVHSHTRSDEVYYVLSGKGVVTVEENSFAVGPGSCVVVPAGRAHYATGTGSAGLRILCVCAPP